MHELLHSVLIIQSDIFGILQLVYKGSKKFNKSIFCGVMQPIFIIDGLLASNSIVDSE